MQSDALCLSVCSRAQDGTESVAVLTCAEVCYSLLRSRWPILLHQYSRERSTSLQVKEDFRPGEGRSRQVYSMVSAFCWMLLSERGTVHTFDSGQKSCSTSSPGCSANLPLSHVNCSTSVNVEFNDSNSTNIASFEAQSKSKTVVPRMSNNSCKRCLVPPLGGPKTSSRSAKQNVQQRGFPRRHRPQY
jgi:hypothetical protein